jgi:cell division protein FtsI (penicillin-binding protein 3)
LTKKSIPSVVGMGLKDALYVLENRGLKVQFSGYGKVVAQSLNPGGPAQGQVISIKLE